VARALAILLLLVGTVRADWVELVGKPAPDFDAKKWIRVAEGYTAQQLEGHVVLIVFWKCATGKPLVPLLNELRDRHFREGLRIVAVTSDAAKDVTAFDVEEGVYYAVAAGATFGGYGSGPSPYAYLTNTGGDVIWQGRPGNPPKKLLKAELRKTRFFVMEPPHQMLEKPTKLFLKGKLSEAAGDALYTIEWAEQYFDKKTAKGRRHIESIRDGAKFIAAKVERRRRSWWRLAREGDGRGDYRQALYALRLLQKHFVEDHWKAEELELSTGDGARAKEMSKRLAKRPDVKRELRAAKLLDAVVQQQDLRQWTAKSKAALLRRYESFIETWDGTYSSHRARRLLGLARAVETTD
jgi:hypothetical protein